MTNMEHPSSSKIQREIEELITEKISKEQNFISQKKTTISGVNFEFDFYNEEKKIIGEIYSGIDNISCGSRKKVITDCFKMVFAEELLGYKCSKILIFIDSKIEKNFLNESWVAKAILRYNITTSVVEIPEEHMKTLIVSRELQKRGNIKK